MMLRDFVRSYYPTAETILHDPRPAAGYYYSAFFAVLLAPIGALDFSAAKAIWIGVQITSVVAFTVISGRYLLGFNGAAFSVYSVLCTSCFPILHNQRWGQVSLPLTLCMISAGVLAARGRSAPAGVILGVAAAAKFYPALMLPYFAVRRDTRALTGFALAAGLCYAAVPAAVLGLENWLRFEQETALTIGRATWMSRDVNSQYIVHVAQRWYGMASGDALGSSARHGIPALGVAVAAANVWAVWALHKRPNDRTPALAVTAVACSIPFLLKTLWPHYFVYLPIGQLAVFRAAMSAREGGSAWRLAAALSIVSMLLSSVFFFSAFDTWRTYTGCGALFLANLLLLPGVYLSALHVIRRRESPTAHPESCPAKLLARDVP